MKAGKKPLIIFLLSLFPFFGIYAQSRPYWYSLEQGKTFFREGHYGNALMAFEDARRSRMDEFTRMESDLILALSAPAARALGDSLDRVETYLAERGVNSAAEALKQLYYRYPKERLGGSVNAALEAVDRLKLYPEAEFWLGETYRAEGELGLALAQYRKAYDARANLETPDFDAEILYKIIEIHRLRKEYQEMEDRTLELLRVPGRDVLWAGESGGFARAAMMRILENEGIGRFLTLYRYGNIQVERAHRDLGLFYYATSRHTQAAEHLMFAFLIQNTVLIEDTIRRRFDFTFTDLASLLAAVKGRSDLDAFLEEVEFDRTLYYLGAALFATGKPLPAHQIWTFLAARPEAGEWQGRARSQLQSPYIEKAVELP